MPNNDLPEDIFNKLKSLVDSINCSLPEFNVVTSNLISRMDNQKANEVYNKVNKLLKLSNYHVLNNNNIKEKDLRKRALHLMLASNLVH